ncbi:unnamed protein product [Enterobius vermicularis]|uniref:Uncharacterized protein n=1 Tax=Enterobius vermicularis TaxID=51028 RepID=A0A0N4V3L9_ENTVE|nr:unnamed protein product [Enterobius vermicularis]
MEDVDTNLLAEKNDIDPFLESFELKIQLTTVNVVVIVAAIAALAGDGDDDNDDGNGDDDDEDEDGGRKNNDVDVDDLSKCAYFNSSYRCPVMFFDNTFLCSPFFDQYGIL